jgi:hypothetical protein
MYVTCNIKIIDIKGMILIALKVRKRANFSCFFTEVSRLVSDLDFEAVPLQVEH